VTQKEIDRIRRMAAIRTECAIIADIPSKDFSSVQGDNLLGKQIIDQCLDTIVKNTEET
jgi:hypothetical protein